MWRYGPTAIVANDSKAMHCSHNFGTKTPLLSPTNCSFSPTNSSLNKDPRHCVSSLSPPSPPPLSNYQKPCHSAQPCSPPSLPPILFSRTPSPPSPAVSRRGIATTSSLTTTSNPPTPNPSVRVPVLMNRTETTRNGNRTPTNRTTGSWTSESGDEWYRTGNRPGGHGCVSRGTWRTYGTSWTSVGSKTGNWTTGCSSSWITVTAYEPKTNGSGPSEPCSAKKCPTIPKSWFSNNCNLSPLHGHATVLCSWQNKSPWLIN